MDIVNKYKLMVGKKKCERRLLENMIIDEIPITITLEDIYRDSITLSYFFLFNIQIGNKSYKHYHHENNVLLKDNPKSIVGKISADLMEEGRAFIKKKYREKAMNQETYGFDINDIERRVEMKWQANMK